MRLANQTTHAIHLPACLPMLASRAHTRPPKPCSHFDALCPPNITWQSSDQLTNTVHITPSKPCLHIHAHCTSKSACQLYAATACLPCCRPIFVNGAAMGDGQGHEGQHHNVHMHGACMHACTLSTASHTQAKAKGQYTSSPRVPK
jgi:hypothetical protein